MSQSRDPEDELVRKYWDDEKQAWKKFRLEMERKWDLLYPGFDERDYIKSVDVVAPTAHAGSGHPSLQFLKEHFWKEKEGWYEEQLLGEANGLLCWARRRVRARHHCFLIPAPAPGFVATPAGPRMQSWQIYLTRPALDAAIRFSDTMEYIVTLNTPRAGASQRALHFQVMPQLFGFGGEKHSLYQSLGQLPVIEALTSPCTVNLVRYPAFCLHISGDSHHVARLVWRLAEEYAALQSLNLVIAPGSGNERSSVFVFPRPWKPAFDGPHRYRDLESGRGWAFGAFEMGGFFPTGDEEVYKSLTYETISQYLREVSIFALQAEKTRLSEILEAVSGSNGMNHKFQSYCDMVDKDWPANSALEPAARGAGA
jgi:hypothetical protein